MRDVTVILYLNGKDRGRLSVKKGALQHINAERESVDLSVRLSHCSGRLPLALVVPVLAACQNLTTYNTHLCLLKLNLNTNIKYLLASN